MRTPPRVPSGARGVACAIDPLGGEKEERIAFIRSRSGAIGAMRALRASFCNARIVCIMTRPAPGGEGLRPFTPGPPIPDPSVRNSGGGLLGFPFSSRLPGIHPTGGRAQLAVLILINSCPSAAQRHSSHRHSSLLIASQLVCSTICLIG